jgi:serine phosphatase RsbU (regulator of sigma subunit)
VPWSPGDRLLMYTDGLSEARDAHGEFLSVSTLASQVRSGPVERAVEEVVDAVGRHVPRGRLEDDLAVVVIEHLPRTAAVGAPAGGASPAGSRVRA